MAHHRNTLMRMRLVCELTQKYYEPGRIDRCYKAVWKHYINPIYPMCYRTFLNYIGTNVARELRKQDQQLDLF